MASPGNPHCANCIGALDGHVIVVKRSLTNEACSCISGPAHVVPQLSMGPFCVTRSNPTHQLTDPTQPITSGKIWTQPNPPKTEKSRPDPTQSNPMQPNPWVNPTHGQL